jgi:hypothetical protein
MAVKSHFITRSMTVNHWPHWGCWLQPAPWPCLWLSASIRNVLHTFILLQQWLLWHCTPSRPAVIWLKGCWCVGTNNWKGKCCFHLQGIRVSYPVDGGSRFLRKAGTLKTTYFNHIKQCQENIMNSITVTATAVNSSSYMYRHLWPLSGRG